MNAYQVKLPVFEGPFDLLYHLIEDQKINIYDIPIAEIAAQYLEYLQMMEILDMEIASGFLVMAATLLEIKSRMLLPKEKKQEEEFDDEFEPDEEFEPDARSELVEKLLEYKKFKNVALTLREMERSTSRIFSRKTNVERKPEEVLEIEVGALELVNIFNGLIRRRISPPVHRVVLEKTGVLEKINHIRSVLAKIKDEIFFDELIKDQKSRDETVVSFMAILEMHKTGELALEQADNFAPIRMLKGSKKKMPNKKGPVDLQIEPDKPQGNLTYIAEQQDEIKADGAF